MTSVLSEYSAPLAAIMSAARPYSREQNSTISASGHNCKLPVFVGFPVALDPRTGERASVELVVQCTGCSAFWCVMSLRDTSGPDLVWYQKSPWTTRGRESLARRAVAFDAATAYAPPDPTKVDWTRPPRKLNGMPWYQLEFAVMLGYGADLCQSTTQMGHGKIGGPTMWMTYHCVLKLGHQSGHESPSAESGVVGWSG